MQQGITHQSALALVAMRMLSLLASLHPCRASTSEFESTRGASTSSSPSTNSRLGRRLDSRERAVPPTSSGSTSSSS